MNAIFTYDQSAATQIGGGSYVTKSGGYDFKIVRAQFTGSQNSQAKALELDLETRDGLKCNYISINYIAGNGQPNDFGNKMIQAIMGSVGVNQLSDNNGNCPELFGKFMKAVVQRVDYTKTQGAKAGQDGYKFDFKLPANMQTGKTVKEQVDNSEAKSFKQYAESITDKDDRTAPQANTGYNQAAASAQPQNSYAQQSGGMNSQHHSQDFDDDIPF